jgi:hypothetical protein
MYNQKVREAYIAWEQADIAWQADLQRVYGNRAGDMRYTREGHSHPECIESYRRFCETGEQWRQACKEEEK